MNLADYAWTSVSPDGTRKGHNRKAKARLTGHPVRRSTREDYGYYRLAHARVQLEGWIVREITHYGDTLGQLAEETILQALAPVVPEAVRLAQKVVGVIPLPPPRAVMGNAERARLGGLSRSPAKAAAAVAREQRKAMYCHF